MKRDHLAFLVAGLAFGFLLGFGWFHARSIAPGAARSDGASAEATGPRGPMAPTQSGAPAGGGPMVAEINELKARLARDPKDLKALVRLANLYHDVSMWPEAAAYYERAVELDASDADLLTDLGVCYRGLQRFDDALAMFDRASAANPRHWQSLYNTIVVAAFDTARFDRAEEALRKLERFDPPPPNLAELRRRVAEVAAGSAGSPGSPGSS